VVSLAGGVYRFEESGAATATATAQPSTPTATRTPTALTATPTRTATATSTPAPGGAGLVDTFSGAAGSSLLSHTSDSGHSWALAPGYSGDARLTADGRLRAGSGFPRIVSSAVPSSGTYTIEADLFVASAQGEVSLLGRYDPAAGTFYSLLYGGGSFRLFRSSGVQLAVAAYPVQAGQSYHLVWELSDPAKTLRVQGPSDPAPVPVFSTSDNAVAGAGRIGVRLDGGGTPSDSIGYHLDNLRVTS
jgi:hypothetical protein